MSVKLLNGTKSMYVNSLACVRVKGYENECFKIDSGVRQGCIMSPWGMGRKGVKFREKRVEIVWPLV